MSEAFPVVTAASQVLAHTPGLARYGSKPERELPKSAEVERRFLDSLRSFDDAVAYPPHQAYLGALHPRELPERPWVGTRSDGKASRFGPAGELMPEEEFLALMAAVDEFDLIGLAPEVVEGAASAFAEHPLGKYIELERVDRARVDAEARAADPEAAPLYVGADRLAGAMRGEHDQDATLTAMVLLENLAAKATGALALLHLVRGNDIDPASIDYVIGCGEEAVGDRYQRGGGNLAKAIATAAGLTEASGADVKNFCAAPVPALVMGAALVRSGVFERVAVVAGGSLAKLGMKFQGHLRHDLPILEDVMGGAALLIERDDGVSPSVRLDCVGRHPVAAGGSNPQILQALAVDPLAGADVKMTSVDDYATELHNPEITEPQGSGNVPERNYRALAALAARHGDIPREDIDAFARERGMPGFAPTQGHLASALCYLPHALQRLTEGDAQKVMVIAKGSLFLGRMSQQSDGMSVLLTRNSKGG